MYRQTDLYLEPREILEYTSEQYCEITAEEQGFLCGIIKRFKPNKVVEIGVAAGGTTAVILKCLENVNSNAKMFSVDIRKECYRRKGKSTGFQMEEVKAYLSNYDNHTFYLGNPLPKIIDHIGTGIDLVILDTMHTMPGEILDFLCILPYLSDNAMVVLHDVVLNYSKNTEAFANKILLVSVEGEKYYNYKDVINIAAFMVNSDTRKNIANVFSALSITWSYFPALSELMIYRDLYKKFYDQECIELFDINFERQYERFRKMQES